MDMNRMRWLPYGVTTKGQTMLKHPSVTWNAKDKKWMKNRNTSKTDTLAIFEKQGFSIFFQLISDSIFHLVFPKNEIKNGINKPSTTDVEVNFQQKGDLKKGKDPPTTQAHSAVARSSCQGVQADPKELGQQKLDDQKWRQCLHNSG